MQSPNWKKLAKRDISARSILKLKNIWAPYNDNFDEGTPDLSSTLSDLFDASEYSGELSTVLQTPNLLANANVDRVALGKKAADSKQATLELLNCGYKSWGSVDAYHSAFFFAKAILSEMGIFHVSLNGANFIVDVFPNHGTHRYKRNFEKDYSNLDNPIRLMTIKGRPIEHRHIWDVLHRIFNIVTDKTDVAREVNWFKNFDYKGFRPARNKIIYTNTFWPFRQNFCCSLETNIPDEIEIYRFQDHAKWQNLGMRDYIYLDCMASTHQSLSVY